jgi:hypothetical protein
MMEGANYTRETSYIFMKEDQDIYCRRPGAYDCLDIFQIIIYLFSGGGLPLRQQHWIRTFHRSFST